MVDVTLVWIPGHCDIHYNDIVDQCAKSVTLNPDNIPSTTVTIGACKKLITKQCRSLWKTRWQRANVGKRTFDIVIPHCEIRACDWSKSRHVPVKKNSLVTTDL